MTRRSILAFLLPLLILTGGCGRKSGSGESEKITVRTEKMQLAVFQEAIRTQGIIEAVDCAALSAMTPGKIIYLGVKEGDHVRKGQILFRSDSQTLENRCTLAEEALKMARERVRTREATLEVAKVAYTKAQTDYKRSRSLYDAHAVSQDTLESRELKFQTTLLEIRQAEASLATAKAEVSFAQATLEIARKRLSDAVVSAPYDGIITAKLRNVNEYCNAGTPVLKIEGPSGKRIAAAVSAQHYPKIKVGQTLVQLSAGGRELCRVPVTILSGSVDPVSRTFEIKADLPEKTVLPSGTLCDVTFLIAERKGLSLPEEALLFQQDGKFLVYEFQNGRAHGIQVTPGITRNGRTEILNAGDLKGKEILISGQYFVNEGTPVQQRGE